MRTHKAVTTGMMQASGESPLRTTGGSPGLMLAMATIGFAVNFWAWALRHAPPADALVSASRSADLVVLIRRSDSRSALPHLGTTARQVMQLSSCPVVILPAIGMPDAPELVLEESGHLLK